MCLDKKMTSLGDWLSARNIHLNKIQKYKMAVTVARLYKYEYQKVPQTIEKITSKGVKNVYAF
jgi:hypothetical protein